MASIPALHVEPSAPPFSSNTTEPIACSPPPDYDLATQKPNAQPVYPSPPIRDPSPIITQPRPGETQNLLPQSNIPQGLEHLASAHQIIIHQHETNAVSSGNRYELKNILGQRIYYAIENSDTCSRLCDGKNRQFNIGIFDNSNQQRISVIRAGSCDCKGHSVEVHSPPGVRIGTIQEEWSFTTPKFSIKNQNDDVILRIEGPMGTTSCGEVIDFNILTQTGVTIGRVSKHWSGLSRELFTHADIFGLTFPLNLDVATKTLLLGATFLIDFMFYES